MRQDLLQQLKSEAAHRQRPHGADRVHLLPHLFEAVQDEAVSTDSPALDARHKETQELSRLPDADARTGPAAGRAVCQPKSPAAAAAVAVRRQMDHRREAVIRATTALLTERSLSILVVCACVHNSDLAQSPSWRNPLFLSFLLSFYLRLSHSLVEISVPLAPRPPTSISKRER